jgi:hypothetical protein
MVASRAEYLAVSVSRKLLSRTPPEISPSNQCELRHVQAANQRRCGPHILNRKSGQRGSYCLSLTARALVTFNIASKNSTLS